jgi:hypothetical protein
MVLSSTRPGLVIAATLLWSAASAEDTTAPALDLLIAHYAHRHGCRNCFCVASSPGKAALILPHAPMGEGQSMLFRKS